MAGKQRCTVPRLGSGRDNDRSGDRAAGRRAIVALERFDDGTFGGLVPRLGAGTRYRYRVDGGAAFPDPASRFQPEGVHGPSEVIDPAASPGPMQAGRPSRSRTSSSTSCTSARSRRRGRLPRRRERLPYLAELGVTAIELMPVADFPGERGTGATTASRSSRRRAATAGRTTCAGSSMRAHRLGLAVFLDVVYNHLGPDGNYSRPSARTTSPSATRTPWGAGLNFDGPTARWCASSSSRTRCTGSTSTTSTACASTPRTRSSTTARGTSWPSSPRASANRPGRPVAAHRRGPPQPRARCCGPKAKAAGARRRLGRRLPPPDARRAGRRPRGLLRRLHRLDDRRSRARSAGLVLHRPVLGYLGEHRGTDPSGIPPRRFVVLHPEPRSGRQPRPRRAARTTRSTRPPTAPRRCCCLCAPADAAALHGPGVGGDDAVPVLHRSREELGRLVTEGRRDEFRHFAAFADPARARAHPGSAGRVETFERSRLRWDERDREPHASMLRLYQRSWRCGAASPPSAMNGRGIRDWRGHAAAASGRRRRAIIARRHRNARLVRCRTARPGRHAGTGPGAVSGAIHLGRSPVRAGTRAARDRSHAGSLRIRFHRPSAVLLSIWPAPSRVPRD